MHEWQAGIHYDAVASTKYKTNQVVLKAILPYTAERAAAWALLSRLMEDGSDQIPSKAALEGILAQLYGASLSVGVQRKGHYLEFVLASHCVRPQLVHDDQLGRQWLALLQGLLLEQTQLHTGEGTAQARFERERTFQLQRIQRLGDDKRRLVAQKLYQVLYQADADLALGGMGDEARVAALTLADVARAHDEICQEAQLYLVANGDLTPEDLTAWLATSGLAARAIQLDYRDNYLPLAPAGAPALTQEAVQGQQANLAMAYRFPDARTVKDRILLQVANGLFGNLPLSRLFTEIREKQSLAYAIYSGLDFNRNLVLVRAGVGPDKVDHVYQEVERQRQDLIQTLADDAFLEEVKLTLLSADVQSRDYQQVETDRVIVETLYPDFDLSTAYYEAVMQTITAADIRACLSRWEFVGAYALVGGRDEATL